MNLEFQNVYQRLFNLGLTKSQQDFSVRWLGQCPSYFSSIKARDRAPNPVAVLSLISRMQSHQNRPMGRELMLEIEHLQQWLFQAGINRVVERTCEQRFVT